MIGTHINHYSLEEELGAGAIGATYRAIDSQLARDVALKVIFPRLWQNRPAFEEAFQEQVRRLAGLDHANIAAVYGANKTDEHLYVAMAYVASGRWPGHLNLRLYRDQRASEKTSVAGEEAVAIALQVAEALSYAHQRGIIHGHLKPENILLRQQNREEDEEPRWQAVVTDLGLAALTFEVRGDATNPLPQAFTYLAPEQTPAHRGPSDERTDVYGLGVVLFELTTGQPFATLEKAEDAATWPDLPPRLKPIVQKMVAREPAERYQTMVEVVQALQPVADAGAPVSPVVEKPVEPAPSETPAAAVNRELLIAAEEAKAIKVFDATPYVRDMAPGEHLTIGSGDADDIKLEDDGSQQIKSQHLHLVRMDGWWELTDLVGEEAGVVLLDGRTLIPEQPEQWQPGQVVQLGRYQLHLRARDEAAARAPRQLELILDPRVLTVTDTAKTYRVGVKVTNNGTRRLYVHVRVKTDANNCLKSLTLLRDAAELKPGDHRTLPLDVQVAAACLNGTYTVEAHSFGADLPVVRAAGEVEVAESRAVTLSVTPLTIRHGGLCRVNVKYNGNVPAVYKLKATSPEEAIRFRQIDGSTQAKTEDQATADSDSSQWHRSRSGMAGRLPMPAWLRTWIQQQALVRRPLNWLNRLRSTERRVQQESKAIIPGRQSTAGRDRGYQRQIDEELTFTTAGDQPLTLQLKAGKRPLISPIYRQLPFFFELTEQSKKREAATGGGQIKPDQALGGQLVVPPLMPTWAVATLAALVLLLATLLMLTLRTDNEPIRQAQAGARIYALEDDDGDGVLNWQEAAREGTNLRDPDSDRDGISDLREINSRSADANDPLKPPPPSPLPPTVTPTPAPTATATFTPLLAATQMQPASPVSLISLGQHDGTLDSDRRIDTAGAEITVGDGPRQQQFKGVLSFATALPENARANSARLRLWPANESSLVEALGTLHLDVSPVEFGAIEEPAPAGRQAASRIYSEDEWIVIEVGPAGLEAINSNGITHFQLYYELTSNQDDRADQVRFHSGDHPDEATRPQLVLQYETPVAANE